MSKAQSFKNVILFIAIIWLLTLGFYRNQWKAAGKKWFYDWKTNADVMLVARLVWSQQAGILADSALLGVGDGQWPMSQEVKLHQYETYQKNEKFNTYWTYNSMIGGQGVVFSILDLLTNYQPGTNLKLFRGITSGLSAIAIALIVAWFYTEFNYFTAGLVLGFGLLSEWLALYGGSIFFQLWAFYIPMFGITYNLYKTGGLNKLPPVQVMSISFFTILIKTMLNGFEFITVTLGMMFIPLVYYSILRGWKFIDSIKIAGSIAIGGILGTISSLFILFFQISRITGGWSSAFQYITFTFGKRTAGEPNEYMAITNPILSTLIVLWKYISQGRAMNIGNWLNSDFAWLRGYLEIQYYQLFLLFTLFGLLFLITSRTGKRSNVYHKTLSLLYTTCFSLFPPLSWLILFRAHSEAHTPT